MTQTTEIQIQNQAGLPFRQKMNLMLSALNTCFAGTSAPTVTEAYMNWLDTSVSPNVLKRRNAADTAFETHPLQSLADAALPRSGGIMTGLLSFAAGVSISSSATVNLSTATGNTVHITGTTGINSWVMNPGQTMDVIFDGVLLLTHNSAANNLPGGANITTTAGDRSRFFYDGTTVFCLNYTRADGTQVAGPRMQLTASVATTSGTAINFTDIPSWAKKISILFVGNSLSATASLLVQIGTSGGVESTGYISNSVTTAQAATGASAGGASNGFVIRMATASAVLYGDMELKLASGNTWVSRHEVIVDSSTADAHGGGGKTLAGVLDRVRVTTTNGTDTFDAGSISLLIEGY